MVQWRRGLFGHATILQRDEDGVLYYIEPQHYESTRGEDGRMSLDDLLMYPNGESRLLETPAHPYGVLRVDDKLFNTNYANLLDSK